MVRGNKSRATIECNMCPNAGSGEDPLMSDEPQDLEEVQRKLDEIQNRKRGDIRWHISRHTAERAIEAIHAIELDHERTMHPSGGKPRRRKRKKRLL